MLHAQRAFDVCRDQVYNYEDCRQLDYYGSPNPALCSKESLDLMKCYEKVEETEPICMHALRKYKECHFQFAGNLIYCEKEMNEFNFCQEKPELYRDKYYQDSVEGFTEYSPIWHRPPI